MNFEVSETWLYNSMNTDFLYKMITKKRAKQLKVTFNKNDELEKKISQLQDKWLNFRAKQRQADQFMSHQDTQSAEQWINQKKAFMISASIRCSEVERSSTFKAHSQWESSTLSDNENKNNHHKFIKLLNSFIFIETDDSICKTWNIKIADKLDVNINHYSTEKICIVYVIFRLEDDADQQIYAKHHVNAFLFYQSLSKLLKHLKEIYKDQNLIQKCHHE